MIADDFKSIAAHLRRIEADAGAIFKPDLSKALFSAMGPNEFVVKKPKFSIPMDALAAPAPFSISQKITIDPKDAEPSPELALAIAKMRESYLRVLTGTFDRCGWL